MIFPNLKISRKCSLFGTISCLSLTIKGDGTINAKLRSKISSFNGGGRNALALMFMATKRWKLSSLRKRKHTLVNYKMIDNTKVIGNTFLLN